MPFTLRRQSDGSADHGIFNLRTTTDKDPLTLPVWRKVMMVVTLSLAAFQGNYAAAAHLIAFGPMSAYYHVSVAAIANTIGIGILGIGVGPLLWGPLASPTGLGRRKTMLLAWSIYVILTFWLAFAKTFNSFAAARFVALFFASAAQVVPAQQIGESFDRRYKGTAMSAWALLMTAGPVVPPLIGAGLLELNPGPEAFRHLYYFVIVSAALVWAMLWVFVPETAYSGQTTAVAGVTSTTASDHDPQHVEKDVENTHSTEVTTAASVSPTPSLSPRAPWYYAIPQPLLKFLDVRVLLCAITFAVTFGWTVGMTIINPQIFEQPPWRFNNVKVGAVYMGALVGAIIGKLLGGYLVDLALMRWRARSNTVYAEQRLWALLVYMPLGIVGLLCYGFGLSERMRWPVPVIAGQGLYYMYFNIVSSILQTYVVEVEPRAATIVITFMNFIKCVYAFGVPFFEPEWALPTATTMRTSFIIQMVVTVVLCGATTVFALFLRNGAWKQQHGKADEHPLALQWHVGRI